MSSLLINILFAYATMRFNLPPNLLSSVCYIESTHNISALHLNDGQGNSVGICQIKHKTAKWLGFKGTEKQLMDPATNIYYAAKFLKKNLDRYGSTSRALVAYNKGNAKGLTETAYSVRVIKYWRVAHND